MLAQLLPALLLVAASPEPEAGWVQLEKSDLTKVVGARWKVELSERRFLSGTPEEWTAPYISVDQARTYIATTNGRLEARSVQAGVRLWVRDDLGSIGASMIEYERALLVGSGSSLLFLDADSGREEGRLDLTGSIGGKMVLVGSTVIIPVRPNTFVFVDAEKRAITGRARRPTPDGITLRGAATPAVDRASQRAYLGFSDGSLAAVTIPEAKELWSAKLGKATEGFADVDTEPQILDGGASVVAASYSGGLYKLDASNGRVLYHVPELRRLTGLTFAGTLGILVASHGDGLVLGIAPEKGAVRWRYRMSKGWAGEPIFMGETLVACPGSDDALAILDARNGKPVQLVALGSGSSAPPVWRNPDLGVLSNQGTFLMLRRGSGTGITAR